MKQLLSLCAILVFAATHLLGQGRSTESIGITEITIIEIAGNGDVWAGSNGQGIAFYNSDSAKWAYYKNANTPSLANDTVTAIYVNAIGGVQHSFIGTTGGATDFADAVPSAISSLPETNVRGIVYRPDSLWIITRNKLALYDSSGVHKTDFNAPRPNITCTQTGVSNCPGLWAGTAANGCFYTSNGTTYTYIDTTPLNQKLVDNRVTAIAIDNQCVAKFIGTRGGFSVCPVGNQCQNFTTANGLPQNEITSVALVCGKVWIGTRDSGVVIFTQPGTFTKVAGLPDGHIASISSLDNNCTAYVASKNGDVALVDSNKTVLNVLSGIEKVNGQYFGVGVYPQPATNRVNFSFERGINNGHLQLCDFTGRIVQSLPINNSSQLSVDISGHPQGIYFYQLYNGNQLIKNGKVEILR